VGNKGVQLRTGAEVLQVKPASLRSISIARAAAYPSIVFFRIDGAIGSGKEPSPHSLWIASADPLLPIGPATVALPGFAAYRGA
jgi:hypothetical protein